MVVTWFHHLATRNYCSSKHRIKFVFHQNLVPKTPNTWDQLTRTSSATSCFFPAYVNSCLGGQLVQSVERTTVHWRGENWSDSKSVSNIGFITVHGLIEGHIAPYTDIEFQLTKYQTYITMKSQDKSLQLIFEETITLLTKIKRVKWMALKQYFTTG